MNIKRIAVVGMGRSGTTYITEFLGKCGVFLDEVNWAYEHELGRLINDTILNTKFGARPGLPYGELPETEIELPEYWHKMAQFFIKYMDLQLLSKGNNTNTQYWAFKDPRTTILHCIWLEHFDVIIGIFRAPQEVVDSYIGQGWIKGFWKKRIALNYWRRFNLSLIHIYHTYRQKKQIYILDYNDDMITQTEILCEKLGLEVSNEAKSLFDPLKKHYTSDKFPKDREIMDVYKTLIDIKLVKQR